MATVTITSSDACVIENETFTVTFQWSKGDTFTGFERDDVTVIQTTGDTSVETTDGMFTGVDGDTYTLELTAVSGAGDIVVTVAKNAVDENNDETSDTFPRVAFNHVNQPVNKIVEALYDRVKADGNIMSLGAILYYGNAVRGSDFPHIILRPVDDVPRHLQDAIPLSITTWDFQIWAESAVELGCIYTALLDILNANDTDDAFIGMLRGRGLPLMTEENTANEIIYSRVVECEITV